LVKQNKYKTYLEIGVRNPSATINRIKCKYKDGVDPAPLGYCKYIMTSDDFFKTIPKEQIYDIIFIDGLHLYKQVLCDIENSLKHLSLNGVIVVHDCNPLCEKSQIEDIENRPRKWNGTSWKAFAFLRMTRTKLSMYVVRTDNGCGIIRRGSQKLFKRVYDDNLNYDFLKRNRKKILNLHSVEKFYKKEKRGYRK
jgi:hypothetical protein